MIEMTLRFFIADSLSSGLSCLMVKKKLFSKNCKINYWVYLAKLLQLMDSKILEEITHPSDCEKARCFRNASTNLYETL